MARFFIFYERFISVYTHSFFTMTHNDRLQKLKEFTTQGIQLSIGTLTGDMMNQAGDLAILEKASINLLHLDVMDGTIWPKISVGPGFLAGLKTPLLKDVHLLTSTPEKHVPGFVAAGADIITVQIEDCDNAGEALRSIKKENVLASAGVYPTTPYEELEAVLDECDLVFLLAIGPDTGKEVFFDTVFERIEKIRASHPDIIIAIDGSVKKDNVAQLAAAKPDLIVTGSAVFDGVDPAGNIQHMKAAIS